MMDLMEMIYFTFLRINLIFFWLEGFHRTQVDNPAPQSDYDDLFNFINNNEYLSENKGKITERNAST